MIEYFLGYLHPQAFTSCLAPIALSVKEGAFVLDMCASPGGKTAQMAQMMKNTGLIIANELYASRHIPLVHTINRLGVLNTILSSYQAQEFPLRDQRFDYILADVPCSGEGRFRIMREGARYVVHKSRKKLPDLQKRIILRGFDLLKEGGEMIYSTCTYDPEENESVVHFLLQQRHSDILPLGLDCDYQPGLLEWKKEIYDRRLEKTARFYPHRIDSVGFFMARIGRRARAS
jgi:NOL1/NOP2/sun family putative RNA methylase